MPNGTDKPLLTNTKATKVTVSGLLAALVGSGGYFVQKAGEEIAFLHANAVRHEAQTASLEEEVKRLETEIVRLENFLIQKLEIKLPEGMGAK